MVDGADGAIGDARGPIREEDFIASVADALGLSISLGSSTKRGLAEELRVETKVSPPRRTVALQSLTDASHTLFIM